MKTNKLVQLALNGSGGCEEESNNQTIWDWCNNGPKAGGLKALFIVDRCVALDTVAIQTDFLNGTPIDVTCPDPTISPVTPPPVRQLTAQQLIDEGYAGFLFHQTMLGSWGQSSQETKKMTCGPARVTSSIWQYNVSSLLFDLSGAQADLTIFKKFLKSPESYSVFLVHCDAQGGPFAFPLTCLEDWSVTGWDFSAGEDNIADSQTKSITFEQVIPRADAIPMPVAFPIYNSLMGAAAVVTPVPLQGVPVPA